MISRIDETKCTGCGKCFALCPLDVLRLDTRRDEAPACQVACPAGVDIRGYMYLIKNDRIDEAVKLMRKALPIPAVTGHVCFHPCEGECARKEVDQAVNINALERHVADYWLEEEAEAAPRLHVGKVAVVGSGPSGLAAAYDLVQMGYAVTIFEAMEEPGGMLRVGIPEYRLPRNVLNAQIAFIRDSGVEFVTKTTVGKDVTIEDLRGKGYKAIFLGIGAQLSKKLKIEGCDLNGVMWGLEFLGAVNLKQKTDVKGKVLVIGGGDVAMDASLSAVRLGATEVEVVCLESREQMPAHRVNIELALEEGVRINNSWGPDRILGRDGRVSGAELVRCTSVFDNEGKFNPILDRNVRKSVNADVIILSLGQACDLSVLPDKIAVKDGTVMADPVSLETELSGVFSGGDAVSGPSSVIDAIASGKRAAISIDRYLRGQDLKVDRKSEIKRVERVPKKGLEYKPRLVTPLRLAVERTKDFKEISLGFSEEMAMLEAERCMTCGSRAHIAYPEDCMTCFTCELKCPYEAIYVHPFKEVLPRAITSWAR